MSGLLFSAEQVSAAYAAISGSSGGLDRAAYVAGYCAALGDINGRFSTERLAVVYRDPDGAANRSYDSDRQDWLGPLVDEQVEVAQLARRHEPGRHTRARSGWIYVLADDAAKQVKIGWTRGDVRARASGVRNASGRDLTINGQRPGTMAEERAIHDRFTDARVRGEWFRRTPEIDAWIAGLS